MLDLHMSFVLSLAYPGIPCTPPPFLLPLRSAISTTEILLCHQDAYVYTHDRAFQTETLISTTKTTIFTPKSLCLQVYIYSREASENFDFRVFIVFLSLRLTLAVSTLVVSFSSTHHSVSIV